MNLKQYAPHVIARPNRPDPIPRMRRRRPDASANDDGTIRLDHLTRAEALRLYRLSLTDVRLYGLTYRLGQLLGITEEVAA